MSNDSLFQEYNDDSKSSLGKLAQKSKDEPFVPIGIVGLIAICGIGAYKFKHRGSMSASMFLMQLRVAAQGAVVGCMTLGLTYSMLREYVLDKKPISAESK